MHIFTRQAVSARNTSSHTFSKYSFIHSFIHMLENMCETQAGRD